MQLYPFCEECKRQGKPSVLATDVDHIVPHKGDPNFFGTQTTGKAFAILATLARLRQRTAASEGHALTVGYPPPLEVPDPSKR